MKTTNAKSANSAFATLVNMEMMIMYGGQTSTENTEQTVKSFWKIQPERDSKYKEWIRSLPCLVCSFEPSDPHHVPPLMNSGKGTKTSDYRLAPLCHKHHQEYHNTGRHTFAGKHNIDFEYVIERLVSIWNKQKNSQQQS